MVLGRLGVRLFLVSVVNPAVFFSPPFSSLMVAWEESDIFHYWLLTKTGVLTKPHFLLFLLSDGLAPTKWLSFF